MDEDSGEKLSVDSLVDLLTSLFRAAGCEVDKADVLARGLVQAETLGRTTHGLRLAPDYLEELKTGDMIGVGEPETISDKGATVVWDGRYLPGIWLVDQAVDLAVARASTYGIASVAIGRSHHIGCPTVYLEKATSRGLAISIATSDPGTSTVAPFGARVGVLAPNALAVGIPTTSEPMLIDISASIASNAAAEILVSRGERFPGLWAIDGDAQLTDDPAALFADPVGSLLPVGGADHGHKGYCLALMIETLTQGLSGHGRAEAPTRWGASVHVQVTDPAAFAGAEEFLRETSSIASRCREAPPMPGVDAVRVPGDRARERRAWAAREGLTPEPGTLRALRSWASALGVE